MARHPSRWPALYDRAVDDDLPVVKHLAVYRGDTWSVGFRFLRGGEPLNLTDAVVEAEARSGVGVRTPLTVTVTNAADGRSSLSLPAGLKAGQYHYDVEVTEADGTIKTWVRGRITLWRDVTNEPAAA
jgi:hypothetical protein